MNNKQSFLAGMGSSLKEGAKAAAFLLPVVALVTVASLVKSK